LTNNINSKSRSGYRAKRKKTNIVLNSLIVVVLLLIIFVAYNIFATGNDNASPKKETTKTEQKESAQKDTEKTKSEDVTSTEDDTDTTAQEDELSEETSTTEESATTEDSSATEEADQSQEVVTEGDGGSETENSSWEPVGTTQTGEHIANYDKSSADWQEMLNAISYATGLDQSNMTVYWLGRDKSTTNGSFSTVASKDNKQKYNVYLQWVDGQGWKPTKVEDLSGNDH